MMVPEMSAELGGDSNSKSSNSKSNRPARYRTSHHSLSVSEQRALGLLVNGLL